MESSVNILHLDDGKVKFEGFDNLIHEATINLLPSGLTIVNGKKTNYFCGHTFLINESKESEDKELIQLLKERKLEKSTYWICVDDVYYESTPHRSSNLIN